MTSLRIGGLCIIVVFCFLFVTPAAAQSTFFTSLLSFNGSNGSTPNDLMQGADGNFYGTTQFGGGNSRCDGSSTGTVFKISPAGMLTTLHVFADLYDGEQPDAGLIQATDGNFYGTTSLGGGSHCYPHHVGTVFSMTPNGYFAALYTFSYWDGAFPTGPLVQNQSFFPFTGTTTGGGDYGQGVVFSANTNGGAGTLYTFCSQPNCTDGATPVAGLAKASDGNFYGTTNGGGVYGYGTVFRITLDGALTTLYSFCSQPNCTDGANPAAALVQASDGNLYGTTLSGGTGYQGDQCQGPSGCGTIFKITPDGALTTLYSFCSQLNCTDGGEPAARLVQATDANLYGTTEAYGGTNHYGTVFKITRTGTLSTLYRFNGSDGSSPRALVEATDGSFYGTTGGGGANGNGTVFRIGFVRTCATCRP